MELNLQLEFNLYISTTINYLYSYNIVNLLYMKISLIPQIKSKLCYECFEITIVYCSMSLIYSVGSN